MQSLAAYDKSIIHIYCSYAAAWLCTVTMFNSGEWVSVLAGIVSVTAIQTSSGHA